MMKCSAEGYLVTLQNTAHALSSVLQEEEIIQLLLEQVVTALSIHKALALLLGREKDQLLVAGALGLGEGYLETLALGSSKSRINRSALTGELVRVEAIDREPEFSPPAVAAEGLKGLLAVPMTVRDHVIGILHVYVDQVEVLQPEEVVMLQAMTDLGALALEKVRLRRSLYRVAEAVSSSQDLEPMLQRVLEAAVDEMWLKAGTIRLLEPKGNLLRLVAAYGLSKTYRLKGEVHLEKSAIDRRVLKGETVVLHDVQSESGFEYPREAAEEGILSVLAVPLTQKDKNFGVIHVYSARPRHFGPVAVTFLKSMANLISLAILNAQLYAALKARKKDLELDLADWYRFLALG
ncbi:MAG: GAF domain-containing protein [Desulfobacterales bacterium]